MSRLVSLLALVAMLALGGWRAMEAPAPRQPAAAEMPGVLTALLLQVYEGFAAEDEFAIYDGIAEAVSDDLVADLYLQQRRAALVAQEDGGVTTILSIDLESWTRHGATLSATWTVLARIDHETHSHERLNRYAASLSLAPAGAGWQIAALDITEVARDEDEEASFFEE